MEKNKTESLSFNCDIRLGEAYIPIQQYGQIYDPWTALMRGTIFPALFRPYRKKTSHKWRSV